MSKCSRSSTTSILEGDASLSELASALLGRHRRACSTVDVETVDVETLDVETLDVETLDVETADVETLDVDDRGGSMSVATGGTVAGCLNLFIPEARSRCPGSAHASPAPSQISQKSRRSTPCRHHSTASRRASSRRFSVPALVIRVVECTSREGSIAEVTSGTC